MLFLATNLWPFFVMIIQMKEKNLYYLAASFGSAGLAKGLGMDVDMMFSDDGPLARGSLRPGLCRMNGGFGPVSGFGNIEALARGGRGVLAVFG